MSRRIVSMFSIAALAFMVVACSEKTNSTNTGFKVGDSGTASGTDSSASDGGATTLADGKVVGDAAGSDATIAAQECVAPGKGDCDSNSECGSDSYCDLCKRSCLTPRKACDPCTASSQCAKAEFGSACLPFQSGGTYCGQACLGNAGCPSGSICTTINGVTAKQCVPKSGDCAPAAGQCKTDVDCPFTTICKVEYGKCLKGCGSDKECPMGKVCSLFRCTDPCTADSDCEKLASEAKCLDKRCKIPNGCLGPNECPKKETFCDLDVHKCKPGCKTDFDCKEFGKKCAANKCITKGCKENWECGFGQICIPKTGKCEKAKGPHCAKCDPQDKKVTACGGAPAKCLSFKDENDKEAGDFCLLGCGTEPGGPCPQGFQCQDIKDQDGKSQGKVCVRQCYIDPFGGTKP